MNMQKISNSRWKTKIVLITLLWASLYQAYDLFYLPYELQEMLRVNQELTQIYKNCSNNKLEPSLIYEKKRRRIHSTIQYMWESVKYKTEILKGKINDTQLLNELIQTIYEHKNSLISDWQQMTISDGYGEWRQQEAIKLSELVQSRFHHLQNPPNCGKAKFFMCYGETVCGWGCQLEKYAQCFATAYGLGRILIFQKVSGAFYEPDEYSKYYEPISENCNNFPDGNPVVPWQGSNDPQILKGEVLRIASPRIKYLLPTMPSDLVLRAEKLFKDPNLWWISQTLKFLLRRKPEVQKTLEATFAKLGLKKPIVGVHVRRTDKLIREAEFYPIEKYMTWVDEYYDILELTQKIDKRRIFLAIDDPKVIEEVRSKYSHYEIIVNEDSAKLASDLKIRWNSAMGIMIDAYMISQCDYLVCTLSSHVTRSVLQLMQSDDIDAPDKVKSIDFRHWVVGENEQQYKVIMSHSPQADSEIAANAGDVLQLADNYDINGMVLVKNDKTQGYIPTFKLEKLIDHLEFPIPMSL